MGMTVLQALQACRGLPGRIRADRALLLSFRRALSTAQHDHVADAALMAIDRKTARIRQLEGTLQAARVLVLNALADLPVTEGEVLAAFYLNGESIKQIATARRCGERYVKRCKKRAEERWGE